MTSHTLISQWSKVITFIHIFWYTLLNTITIYGMGDLGRGAITPSIHMHLNCLIQHNERSYFETENDLVVDPYVKIAL